MFDEQCIHVILPLALPRLYTYSVPEELLDEVAVGKRVEVQFGQRKLYAALVHSFTQDLPEGPIKPIVSVLDEEPILHEWQIEFWTWLSGYYLAYMGEVMTAALPSAFKLSSETTFLKNPAAKYSDSDLSGDEFQVMEALDFQDELSLDDIQLILSRKSVMAVIKSLVQRRLLYLQEELVERYKPRVKPYVRLAIASRDEAALNQIFEGLKRATKQQVLLTDLLRITDGDLSKAVAKKELLQESGTSAAVFKALVDKGVLEVEDREVDRLEDSDGELETNELDEQQTVALASVRDQFKDKEVVLLHGITSSGKTHVYVELIRESVAAGKQVLFLVPEIALTSQLIRRLRRWLGDIGVYHSRFNDRERIEIWRKVQDGRYSVVIGARSSMFLPFGDLGLVIVDEEHDMSYKQVDPAPRYHARDAAIYLAHMHQAKVILGSATPSFETYFNAQQGRYGLTEMSKRYRDIQPPKMVFSDLGRARHRDSMQGPLTMDMSDAVLETLEGKGQVILFQNRRGYAPYLMCGSCNHIPQCRNCDVSLTYHKYTQDLRCHYCGYRQASPRACTSCHSQDMQLKGMGTERIEDELRILYPDAQVARMDLDAVRRKHGHERIIARLEDGEIDILVGTQMVTKGLDFENVKLVGVLNADALLYFPDFRAIERAYQTLMQVSGRAGRKGKRGKVIIQMSDMSHPIIKYLKHERGYWELYRLEIGERREFKYPPFIRYMRIILKHKDYRIVERGAQKMADALKREWGTRIQGPIKPVIARIRNQHIREITVKMERKADVIRAIKDDFWKQRDELYQYNEFRSLRIYADVDAMT